MTPRRRRAICGHYVDSVPYPLRGRPLDTRSGCGIWRLELLTLDADHPDLANDVEMPDRMTPPACNELSATWHRRRIAKSKTTLGIPSAEHTLRN